MTVVKMVRVGVFETNSSSCHSISLGKSGVYTSITPDADNVVRFESGEFGWGPETVTEVAARLSYAFIYASEWSGWKSEQHMTTLKKVVCSHTGASDIQPLPTKWGDSDGYIDHQSVECSELDHLFADEDLLKTFIFDDSTEILIRNDNENY